MITMVLVGTGRWNVLGRGVESKNPLEFFGSAVLAGVELFVELALLLSVLV